MRHLRETAPARLPLILVTAGAVVLAAILALYLVRGETYRGAMDAAAALPAPLPWVAAAISAYGIPVLLVLMTLAVLRAGRHGPRVLARGVAAGAGVVVAYLSSETLKLLVTEPRPCRTFAVTTIANCPAASDWSWPSNHATVAAAIAVAILLLWPRLAVAALPLAGLIALSRVVLGVHYAHDVLAGALLGTVVVIVCATVGAGPAGALLRASRRGHRHRGG